MQQTKRTEETSAPVHSLCDQGFPLVYRRFYGPIRSYVRKKVACEGIADDLAQEVFLKVYRFRASYNSTQALATWLWRIAANTVVDWYRSTEGKTGAPPDEDIPCLKPSAEASLIAHEVSRELLGKLRRLTGRQRRAAELRLVHQLPFSQIAKKMKISVTAAKCSYGRAKEALALL